MTTDIPSSDELIRRAKQTLRLETEDFLPKVDDELAIMGASTGDISFPTDGEPSSVTPSVSARPPSDVESARQRRVESSSQDHLVVVPRRGKIASVPVPPSPFTSGSLTDSGRVMRIVGNLLIGIVAVVWVLLLIGLIDNPDDLGETLGGGAVMTLIPFLFGMVLRRAGKRRGIAA